MNKSERISAANKALEAISRHGRRFFLHKGRVSRFEICYQGRIWYRDAYTNRRVSTHHRSRWKGFTEGGTLQSICKALLNFIKTGEPIHPGYFGPWPDHYCGGDLWGYGKANMALVRQEVMATGAVRSQIEREPK